MGSGVPYAHLHCLNLSFVTICRSVASVNIYLSPLPSPWNTHSNKGDTTFFSLGGNYSDLGESPDGGKWKGNIRSFKVRGMVDVVMYSDPGPYTAPTYPARILFCVFWLLLSGCVHFMLGVGTDLHWSYSTHNTPPHNAHNTQATRETNFTDLRKVPWAISMIQFRRFGYLQMVGCALTLRGMHFVAGQPLRSHMLLMKMKGVARCSA